MEKVKRTSPVAGEGNNPYLNGSQVWMERYGSYVQWARIWCITAILSIIVAMISIAGNIYQMTQSKIDRYFVAVDDLGKAVAEKIHNETKSTPERVVLAEIVQAITNWRSVTVDTALQSKMIRSLNAHTAGAAKGMLAEWYKRNNPTEVAKSGRLIEVEVKGVPLAITSESYRVEWTEIVRDHKGIEIGRQNYEAIATIQISSPTSEEEVLANPGGVYIVNLTTGKILK